MCLSVCARARLRVHVCVCVSLSCCVWASRLEKQIISGRTGTDGGRRRKGTIMCSWCWSSGCSGPTQDVLCSICWASLIRVSVDPFFIYWRICWCHLHCDSVSKHTGPFLQKNMPNRQEEKPPSRYRSLFTRHKEWRHQDHPLHFGFWVEGKKILNARWD